MTANKKQEHDVVTKRQQQAAETKSKLLAAAEKLIKEKDFNSVSVSDITAECGLAAGTFYLYFKSKDDLLLHFSNKVHEDLEEAFRAMPDCSALERMKVIINKWFDSVGANDHKLTMQTYRLYIDMAIKGQKDDKANRSDYEINLIRDCLQQAVASGELKSDIPTEFISTLIGVSMHGSASHYSSMDSEFSLSRWRDEFLDYVFGTLLKPYIVE